MIINILDSLIAQFKRLDCLKIDLSGSDIELKRIRVDFSYFSSKNIHFVLDEVLFPSFSQISCCGENALSARSN
jgi:hypothetical protein